MSVRGFVWAFGGFAAALVAAMLGYVPPIGLGLTALLSVTAAVALGQSIARSEEKSSALMAQASELEVQLNAQRASFAKVNEGLQIALFLCDRRSAIIEANPKAKQMFDFAEPAGRTLTAVTLSRDLERLVDQSIQLGEPQQADISFSYPVERVCLAEARYDPGGELVIVTLYEITELRRLERVRQDFVANVSHELRTPLTTIRLMSETLLEEEEGADPELRDRYLRKIVSEVDRLSSIAGDLLVLSSAELNPVRKQECDLSEVVRSVAHQLERKALDKGLALSFESDQRLVIEANPSQMAQVAINLIDNAINYTAIGSVDVRVYLDRDMAALDVQDTGIGIASEHVPRLFERFYRVDKGRSRMTGGTGLGLSIVRHLVESHGGTVTVESALNVGTTFKVRLPVGEPEST